MTPAEKQAFDAMREALKEACGNRCNAEYNPCYARAAIAAADAVAEQGSGWQPIETAPKDSFRAKIEVWTATGKLLVVYWDAICGEWRHIDYSGNLYAINNATHWRHIPPGPHTMTTPSTAEERMAGARQKMIDDYSSDILARQGDGPK